MDVREQGGPSDFQQQIQQNSEFLAQLRDEKAAHDDLMARHQFAIISAPPAGLHCGLWAVASSFRAQYPDLAAPPVATLVETLKVYHLSSPAMAEATAGVTTRDSDAFDDDIRWNYTAGHLNSLLRAWLAAAHRGAVDMVLGIVPAGRRPFLVENRPGTLELWIYRSNLHINEDGDTLNQYSGLQPSSSPRTTPPGQRMFPQLPAKSRGYRRVSSSTATQDVMHGQKRQKTSRYSR